MKTASPIAGEGPRTPTPLNQSGAKCAVVVDDHTGEMYITADHRDPAALFVGNVWRCRDFIRQVAA